MQLGDRFPDDWDDWPLDKQLAWARRRLAELSGLAESEMVQSVAANALARNLVAEKGLRKATDEPPSQAQTMSRGYLEAVVAEASAKLAEMDRKKS